MNKLGFLLLASTFCATSALAGEVDARYPQVASSTPATIAVAIAEAGVSTRWNSTPTSRNASKTQMAELLDLNNEINIQVSEDLEQRIAEKMELSFTH